MTNGMFHPGQDPEFFLKDRMAEPYNKVKSDKKEF
jgi:hypothetical protein